MSTLLGLDIGGGGGRALLIDSASGDTTSVLEPWSFPVAAGSRGIGVDADLDAIFAALCLATRRALEKSGTRGDDVAAVAVTAMRFGTVILGENGEVLYAGPNRDGRAAIQGITLAGQHGAEIAGRSGRFPNPGFPIARLLWLKQSDPDAFGRAQAMVSLNDWMAFKLCGELGTDASQAAETGIFDLRAGNWAEDLIERIGLTMRPFPKVRQAGSKLGELGAEAAAQLGLEPGIVVSVGGGDTQCAMLGAGATDAGAVGIVGGTTAPMQWVLDEVVIDPEHRIWSGQHVVLGRYLLEANPGPVGEALNWAGRVLHPTSPSPAAALLGSAASAARGAGGILSTFGAAVHDGTAIQLPIGSVTLSHLFTPGDPQRPELARAIVEGLAFGLRKNLELLEAEVDGVAERVVFTGGMSRSDFFAQLLSDVLGIQVEAADCHESAALGAALCAGVGAGVFESLEAGAAALTRRSRCFSPDSEASSIYQAQYADWDRLREAQADADAVGRRIRMTHLLSPASDSGEEARELRRTKILVTATMDDESLELLNELGDVTYSCFRDSHTLLTGPSLVEALRGQEVFICEVDPVDGESIQKCKDLRAIATCRSDPVNIDIPGMTALGIPVINAPGRNSNAVADITVGFAISLARKLLEANEFLRDEEVEAGDLGKMGAAFGKLQGHELWRKTFGLVGFGAVGRKVAERLIPFGVRVVVSDPFVSAEQAALCGATKLSFLALLQESDFVSLHAPATESTKGMMGAEQFRAMKKGSFFINTARAALIDEEALAEALEEEHIAAAALDVFSVEPPGWDHPLLELDHVIATPHIGGNTHEVATHQGRIIAEDLKRILRGEMPLHTLNPECLRDFDLSQPRHEVSPEALEALTDRARPAVSDLQKRVEPARKPARDESRKEEDHMAAGIPEENRRIMARICREFVRGIITDAKLASEAPQDVALHFTISDLGEELWFGFADGSTSGGMGPPPRDADVQLKMKAYILDGMFTGTINAMEKAMEGELSFMGDAAKAMTLQDMQPDLGRLYQEARDRVGDPGDLEQLSKASAQKAKRGKAGAATVVPAGRPRVGDERDELCDVVDELYRIQLITATGGNVSVRVPGEEAMWITPSAMFKGNLDPEIMVKLGMDGKKVGEGGNPSSESLVHLAIYRARPRAKAVIHCHAPNATILANTDLPFLPISTEAAFLGEIPRLPFIMPGTTELADAVGKAAQDSHAVLLKNHGLLVAGMSLRKAADMTEVVERSAEIILGCYAVGKEPPVLPDDVVAQLREMGDMMA